MRIDIVVKGNDMSWAQCTITIRIQGDDVYRSSREVYSVAVAQLIMTRRESATYITKRVDRITVHH